MADPFAPRSMKRKNVKGLALTPAAPKPPPTAENAHFSHSRNNQSEDTSAQLEIGIEFNLDLRPEDLEIIKDLGQGNGGTVSKVKHIPTNTTMARKVSRHKSPRSLFSYSNSGHRLSTWKPSERCASVLYENSRSCTTAIANTLSPFTAPFSTPTTT